jgi:hypothetical protein
MNLVHLKMLMKNNFDSKFWTSLLQLLTHKKW